ncbi:MAG: PKD domain-containing protein [Bacteroidales bacterium]
MTICRGQELYEIEKPSFNSLLFDEAFPAYYEDGIVFSSNRRTSYFVSYTMFENNENLFNYFISKKQDNKWTNEIIFSESLITRSNKATVVFNRTGNKMYFTRNVHDPGPLRNFRGDNNFLNIYVATKMGNEWTNITPLFGQEELGYHIAYPSLSADDKTIYFSSDMPGGEGRWDLYYSTFERGRWSDPVSLGPTINTSGDELFPFIHESGRLYFSSWKHNTMGRLDIFYTEFVNGKWTEPVQLPEPINSRYDDYSFIANEDLTNGYFCSDRDRSSDDIFEFKSLFPEFSACKEVEENNYCFVFYEQGSMQLDTTSLEYEWDLGDGTKVRGLEAEHCFEGPGFYLIQLNVIDTLTGEVYFNEATYEFPLEKIEQVYITGPDTCYAGEEIQFSASETNLKDFEINYYYWKLGSYTKKTGEKISHVFHREGLYNVQLGVTSVPGRRDNYEKKCGYKSVLVLPPRGMKLSDSE